MRRIEGVTLRGPRAVVAEVLLLVVVVGGFSWVHGSLPGNPLVATTNAQALQGIERLWHLDLELPANHWLSRQPALITASVLIYRLYYLPLLVVLGWVYVRHRAVYLRVRRTFVIMTVLALVVFWVCPVSPPRFALPGIADLVVQNDIWAHHRLPDQTAGANLTAMPNLHVGWAAWCGYAVWSGLRECHPRTARLGWLFPLLMIAVVVGTGNHYLLDVVGSGLLLIVAVAGAAGWAWASARR